MADTTRIPPKGGSGTAPPRKTLTQVIPSRCDNCRYGDVLVNDDGRLIESVCRRHAPRPSSARQGDGSEADYTVWPPVEPWEWCGEWARR